MNGEILITDTLFIFPEHEQKIRDAGYEIVRVAKPDLSENELCLHVKGKVGYVLGGIEKVTTKVIENADKLRVVAFTGSDSTAYVPGMGLATERGIAVSATPAANSFAVAEYTITVILAMIRNIFDLGRTGNKKFQTTDSLKDLTIGIVGMGHIGTLVAKSMLSLGAKRVMYWNRTRKPEVEKDGVEYVSNLDELFKLSDVISLHISKNVGDGFVDVKKLAHMKDGALIVNCGFTGCINNEALYQELVTGRLRAVQDDPVDLRFNGLPLFNWFCSNSHTAYNTHEANRTASDMATHSLLNLLSGKDDEYKVN